MTHGLACTLAIAAIFGAVLVLCAAPLEWWNRPRSAAITAALLLLAAFVACCGAP